MKASERGLFYFYEICTFEVDFKFMKFIFFPLLAIAVAIIAPACSKYPNGPKFTLHSKTNRIVNDWKLTSYMINGNEFIESQPEIKFIIEKDGTYSRSASQTVLGQIQTAFDNGTWSFSDDKTSILILAEGEDLPVSYTINELRAKKLVLQYYDKVTNITYISTYETDK